MVVTYLILLCQCVFRLAFIDKHIPPSSSMLGIMLIKYSIQGMYGYKCYFHNKINFNILTYILNYSRPPTPLMCYGNRIDGLKGNGEEYPDG